MLRRPGRIRTYMDAASRGEPMRSLAIVALLVAAPQLASACTVCDSDVGQQVRAGIFNDGFWSTLLAIVAPFPVLLGGVAAVQFGLFRSRKPGS